MKIKKGDTVEIVAGKDKGARGKVLVAIPEADKVIVEGVNFVTKHTKVQQTARGSKNGGIVTAEAAIAVSNVMLVGPNGKPTRVGYRFEEVTDADSNTRRKKVRVARNDGKDID
ncbi:MAG: 50S ribosomal protein L24 [Mycobacteriales bacterium]